MLRSLCFLAALAATAQADVRTYDIKPVRQHSAGSFTCGAISRMLRDKHVMKIKDDGTVWINGFKWTVVHDEPDLVLEFHTENRSVVYLEMDMYVNMRGLSGVYFLWGVEDSTKKDHGKCYDSVYVDGTAR